MKFKDLFDKFADYPAVLEYHLLYENKVVTGNAYLTEALDEFANKHADDEVTDFTIFAHNGGIGLTVYLKWHTNLKYCRKGEKKV